MHLAERLLRLEMRVALERVEAARAVAHE